jgi:hypothetical protein
MIGSHVQITEDFPRFSNFVLVIDVPYTPLFQVIARLLLVQSILALQAAVLQIMPHSGSMTENLREAGNGKSTRPNGKHAQFAGP